jgi:hypothetical protein
MWKNKTPVRELGIDVPKWIDQDINPGTIAAICQGGCESGAYMPAVTYFEASKTMYHHGDAILEFIEEAWGEVPTIEAGQSWCAYDTVLVSKAVELWASAAYSELEELELEGEAA